jgi:proteasome accessory factor C
VPSRDEQSTRVVEPRAITRVGDATYLDAWCHTAQGDRAFRLDRIVTATELPDAVSERAAEPRDLSGGWFRGEGETVSVTLRLWPEAQWVPEYYPVVDTAAGPEGTLDVVLEVASEAWLQQLLFRVAPHARVVAPQEFAQSFTANARATLRLYDPHG